MKEFIFTDVNNTINVHVKTDIVNDSQENFNVLSVVDLSNGVKNFFGENPTTEAIGIHIKQLPYSITSFKKFALDKGLKITLINMNNIQSTSVLVDYTSYYSNGGLGVDNI